MFEQKNWKIYVKILGYKRISGLRPGQIIGEVHFLGEQNVPFSLVIVGSKFSWGVKDSTSSRGAMPLALLVIPPVDLENHRGGSKKYF